MKIGFIGLGAMGGPMAKNLIEAGYDVAVKDINQEKLNEMKALGGRVFASDRELFESVDILFTSLPNGAIVESTFTGDEGALANLKSGSIVVDLSSIEPIRTKKLSQMAKDKGIDYLDCPVSGGVGGAEKGTLTVMVGGDKETFSKVEEFLKVIGEKIYYIGESGSGQAIKMINNMLLAINTSALCEALVLGQMNGLKLETMQEIIAVSSGMSYSAINKLPNFILKENYEPGFAIDLQYKDLGLALETGRAMSLPLPMANASSLTYEMAKAKGLGRSDITALYKLWSEEYDN